MKTISAFVVGCGFALMVQSLTAGAASEEDLLSVVKLRSEVRLLKTELATVKLDVTSRLNGVELETQTVRERLSHLENGEAKQMPLIVR